MKSTESNQKFLDRWTIMGVAKYIKNNKDAIEEVTLQSGIKVKTKYGPEDLEEVGFDYDQDLADPGEYPSPEAFIRRLPVPRHGRPGSTRDSARRTRRTNGSSS